MRQGKWVFGLRHRLGLFFGLFIGLAVPLVIAAALAGDARASASHWSFEANGKPDLQGWKLVSDPAEAGPVLVTRTDPLIEPINPEGHSYVTSAQATNGGTDDGGSASDTRTMALVSPEFKLTHRYVSFLARGTWSDFGDRGQGTSVSVCAPDAAQPYGCAKLVTTAIDGVDDAFKYRIVDLHGHLGKRVFFLVNDTSTTRRMMVDDVRANGPTMPMNLNVEPAAKGYRLSWDASTDTRPVDRYQVLRATSQEGPWELIGSSGSGGTRGSGPTFIDRNAPASRTFFYRVRAIARDGSKSEANLGVGRRHPGLFAKGKTHVYAGADLTAIEFPVGGNGAGGIRHFGTGERNQSWIFNTYGLQPPRYTSMVPNSFFAIRAKRAGKPAVVRALQTRPVGSFRKMKSLTFTGEYPLASYRFEDPALPVKVTEGVSSPMIPAKMKDSAVPTALYEFRLRNTSSRPVRASILATQQNAVGFDGEGEIGGPTGREFEGYGSNRNRVERVSGRTRLSMTGDEGSMALSMWGGGVTGTSTWDTGKSLQGDFRAKGSVTGQTEAASSADGVTVDGALARSVRLGPGQTKVVRVALSWNIPGASRIFGGGGMKYSSWWRDADAVDNYIAANRSRLERQTRRYHDTFYESNLPRYVLDRITGNSATLRSPTMFWADNDFFGGWEGLGCCWNMPTHVWHYAQTPARLWPQIGRKFEAQWMKSTQPDGMIPYRYNTPEYAIDGQLGVVLSAYRDHLSSSDNSWLDERWPAIKSWIEYSIAKNDADRDGVLEGAELTTLDFPQDINNTWLGSLYLAALKASARMAALTNDPDAADYAAIFTSGRVKQAEQLWRGDHFAQNPNANLPAMSQANAVDIDMLLGQWWASQLGLGDIYRPTQMKRAMGTLYRDNFHQSFLGPNPFESYYVTARHSRFFVDLADGGMIADSWPDGGEPARKTPYSGEVWAGREYSAAATMIGLGRVRQGLKLVEAVSSRYDGRLRDEPPIYSGGNVWLESCGAGDGAGNPFGDVECGKWYGRSLSSWSLLTALQGLSFDGPAGRLGFAPRFKPAKHRSFFTAGKASGLFSQVRSGQNQSETIKVAFGSLHLRELEFRLAGGKRVRNVQISVGKKRIHRYAVRRMGSRIRLELRGELTVKAGQRLRANIKIIGGQR